MTKNIKSISMPYNAWKELRVLKDNNSVYIWGLIGPEYEKQDNQYGYLFEEYKVIIEGEDSEEVCNMDIERIHNTLDVLLERIEQLEKNNEKV